MTAVSTFSGCGGSSLGLKAAGFRVLWASEFVEAARTCYRDNHPGTDVDSRDIRTVAASDILSATGLAVGELDLLEGSPPCSSFSTAGIRDKGWGQVRDYSGGRRQRSDDLFFEFIRMVDGLRPKVFVAENVTGLVKGKARVYYYRLLKAFADSGYVAAARIVCAHYLGVAQKRERVIFVGVRNDIGRDPAFPTPLPHVPTFAEAVAGILDPGPFNELKPGSKLREIYEKSLPGEYFDQTLSRVHGLPRLNHFTHCRVSFDEPVPTVCALATSLYHPLHPRSLGINELRRVCGFPDSFILTGSVSRQWERLGRAVPPPVMAAIAETIRKEILR